MRLLADPDAELDRLAFEHADHVAVRRSAADHLHLEIEIAAAWRLFQGGEAGGSIFPHRIGSANTLGGIFCRPTPPVVVIRRVDLGTALWGRVWRDPAVQQQTAPTDEDRDAGNQPEQPGAVPRRRGRTSVVASAKMCGSVSAPSACTAFGFAATNGPLPGGGIRKSVVGRDSAASDTRCRQRSCRGIAVVRLFRHAPEANGLQRRGHVGVDRMGWGRHLIADLHEHLGQAPANGARPVMT